MEQQVIRLMPEHACDFPVWEVGSDLPPEFVADEDLRRDILAWNRIFEEHYDWDGGWSTTASREWFAAAAPGLVERLQRHLGPDYRVVAELWPCRAD